MIQITKPFHGAVLNHRHGEQTADGLRLEVRGQAPLRAGVTVNGQPARRAGPAFVGEVVLFERLDVALRWLTERGYEPVFFHQGLLGGPEPEA